MTISLTRTTCFCLSAISSSWRNRVRGASINSLTKSSIPALGDCFSCRELVLCSATTRQPLAKGWTAKCIDDPDVADRARSRFERCRDGGVARVPHISRVSYGARARYHLQRHHHLPGWQLRNARGRDVLQGIGVGVPRFFLAANSGARIGMAQSLKSKFQVGEELSGQFIPLC
jgi:hypothetical protein